MLISWGFDSHGSWKADLELIRRAGTCAAGAGRLSAATPRPHMPATLGPGGGTPSTVTTCLHANTPRPRGAGSADNHSAADSRDPDLRSPDVQLNSRTAAPGTTSNERVVVPALRSAAQ